MRLLKAMLIFIGIVQVFFGIIFMLIPSQFANMVGLETAPTWVNWLFVMMSARFLRICLRDVYCIATTLSTSPLDNRDGRCSSAGLGWNIVLPVQWYTHNRTGQHSLIFTCDIRCCIALSLPATTI